MFNVPLRPSEIQDTIIPYLEERDSFIKTQSFSECAMQLYEED